MKNSINQPPINTKTQPTNQPTNQLNNQQHSPLLRSANELDSSLSAACAGSLFLFLATALALGALAALVRLGLLLRLQCRLLHGQLLLPLPLSLQVALPERFPRNVHTLPRQVQFSLRSRPWQHGGHREGWQVGQGQGVAGVCTSGGREKENKRRVEFRTGS